jgi:hypothetical protein
MLIFKKGVNLKEVLADPEKRKIVGEAITNFLREGFYDSEGTPINPVRKKLTAELVKTLPLEMILAGEYITAGDITTGAAVGIKRKEVFIPEVPADTQYLEIFRTVPSDKAGETYETLGTGLTFTQLKPGQKPELGTVSRTKNYIPNLKWGTAFGFFREWIADNEVRKIEDVIREAKIAAFDAKATFMYGLIAAASWAVKDSMVVQTRGERLTMVPDIIDSSYIEDSDKRVYVLIPKERLILQEREALRTETEKDIMLDAEAYAWYFRMNGIVLDTDYGRKITYT